MPIYDSIMHNNIRASIAGEFFAESSEKRGGERGIVFHGRNLPLAYRPSSLARSQVRSVCLHSQG